MEVNILLIRCTTNQKTFGVRVEKMADNDWWRTWAFKMDSDAAHAEGYDQTPIQGNLYSTDEYPGCPYCATKGFLQCVKCKKIVCYRNDSSVTCPWCGHVMNNFVSATSKFDVSGGGF